MIDSLRKRHEFLSLRHQGVSHVTSYFILQARDTKTQLPARYGLTASKKIGNAVIRNRARRRLRALVRLQLADKAQTGWHYGLIARFPLADAPFEMLAAAFDQAISAVHSGTHNGDKDKRQPHRHKPRHSQVKSPHRQPPKSKAQR